MRDITTANFGLLIAFVIPGSILLWGLTPYSVHVQSWLAQSSAEPASVAGFLFVTVASVGLGQLLSTIRWIVIDRILEAIGVARQPKLRKLNESAEAFDRLVEHHYRHYQSHANSLVALWLAAPLRWAADGFSWTGFAVLLLVSCILWLGALDTLTKYRSGMQSVLTKR